MLNEQIFHHSGLNLNFATGPRNGTALVFFHGVQPPAAILYFRIHPVVVADVLSAARRALAEVPDGMFAVITVADTRMRSLVPSALHE